MKDLASLLPFATLLGALFPAVLLYALLPPRLRSKLTEHSGQWLPTDSVARAVCVGVLATTLGLVLGQLAAAFETKTKRIEAIETVLNSAPFCCAKSEDGTLHEEGACCVRKTLDEEMSKGGFEPRNAIDRLDWAWWRIHGDGSALEMINDTWAWVSFARNSALVFLLACLSWLAWMSWYGAGGGSGHTLLAYPGVPGCSECGPEGEESRRHGLLLLVPIALLMLAWVASDGYHETREDSLRKIFTRYAATLSEPARGTSGG